MTKIKSLLKQISLLAALAGVALITLNFQISAPIKAKASKAIIDTNKFSISTPLGWSRHTQTSNGFEILFIMAPPADNFSPNLNILTENLNGLSIDEYFKASMEAMKNNNMIMDGSGVFVANGMNGKYSTSTFNYQGRAIATKTYVFINDGQVYVLTGSCLITQKDTYRPIFDQTVKTFKFK